MSEPLFLDSVMQEKIWGGEKLEKYFGLSILSRKTGEYWGISGHNNGPSIVSNGKYKGKSLSQLFEEEPWLFGDPKDKVFPLLTKILDANEWLSVQVHPYDNYSLKNESELGKTECWYILDAEPGSEIILGHNIKDKNSLKTYIANKEWNKLFNKIPVKKGDFFYIPSGTIHAIGPGLLILETQQSSDTTYRVYDFDRLNEEGKKRELHIDKAIDVISVDAPVSYNTHVQAVDNICMTTFVSNDFFTVEKWEINGYVDLKKETSYKLFTVIDGEGEIIVDNMSYPLIKGKNFILPSDVISWSFDGDFSVIVSQK